MFCQLNSRKFYNILEYKKRATKTQKDKRNYFKLRALQLNNSSLWKNAAVSRQFYGENYYKIYEDLKPGVFEDFIERISIK